MRPSLWIGICFGLVNFLANISILPKIKNSMVGLMLASGLLFFNTMFSVLFTKKAQKYILQWNEGMKASVQAGIMQSLFYFGSLIVIQEWIAPGYFPGEVGFGFYAQNLAYFIIGFSVFSFIFGFISSGLFHTQKA